MKNFAKLSLGMTFALWLAPKSLFAPCFASFACNTEPCHWECWTSSYGEWARTCFTLYEDEVYHCCVCQFRQINCSCLGSPDTGVERRQVDSNPGNFCIDQGHGVCYIPVPLPN
jgi:hypothetical protein